MDIPWGSQAAKRFVTNVGLITSNGPHGHNVMAAEWTHHVSYSPGLISVHVNFSDATNDNIRETEEFGVNLAAHDQNVIASTAGGFTGKEVDKIAVMEELGVEFYEAGEIDVLMIEGAVLNVECRVREMEDLGDHTAFVGEAVSIDSLDKDPLVYSQGKYWRFGDKVEKPEGIKEKVKKLAEKHSKS